MELRLLGTRQETARTVHALRAVLQLRSVSHWHPNRGSSALGRVYLDVDPPHLIPTTPAHTDTEQTP